MADGNRKRRRRPAYSEAAYCWVSDLHRLWIAVEVLRAVCLDDPEVREAVAMLSRKAQEMADGR